MFRRKPATPPTRPKTAPPDDPRESWAMHQAHLRHLWWVIHATFRLLLDEDARPDSYRGRTMFRARYVRCANLVGRMAHLSGRAHIDVPPACMLPRCYLGGPM